MQIISKIKVWAGIQSLTTIIATIFIVFFNNSRYEAPSIILAFLLLIIGLLLCGRRIRKISGYLYKNNFELYSRKLTLRKALKDDFYFVNPINLSKSDLNEIKDTEIRASASDIKWYLKLAIGSWIFIVALLIITGIIRKGE